MTTYITNIGLLATPGDSARRGRQQGEITLLRDAWVAVEGGKIAAVGQGQPAPEDGDTRGNPVWAPGAERGGGGAGAGGAGFARGGGGAGAFRPRRGAGGIGGAAGAQRPKRSWRKCCGWA